MHSRRKIALQLLCTELYVTEKCLFAICTDKGNFFQTISLVK